MIRGKLKKKGVVGIITTVLIILVILTTVIILWNTIVPILKIDIPDINYNSILSVVLENGYTFYDSTNNRVGVELKAEGTDLINYAQIILILTDGTEIISYHDAPPLYSRLRYDFDFSSVASPPTHVATTPIFVKAGKIVFGKRTVNVELPVEAKSTEFYDDIIEPPLPPGINDIIEAPGNTLGVPLIIEAFCPDVDGDLYDVCDLVGFDPISGSLYDIHDGLQLDCEDDVADSGGSIWPGNGCCLDSDGDGYDICNFGGYDPVLDVNVLNYDINGPVDCDDDDSGIYPSSGCCDDLDGDGYDTCDFSGNDGYGSSYPSYDSFLRDCDDDTYDDTGGNGVSYGCCVDGDSDCSWCS